MPSLSQAPLAPFPTIGNLLFEGCSVASVHQMLDAGIDSDLADALVAR